MLRFRSLLDLILSLSLSDLVLQLLLLLVRVTSVGTTKSVLQFVVWITNNPLVTCR